MQELDALAALHRAGRPDEVIRQGELLRSRYSNNATFLNLLGDAYLDAGEPLQAEQNFRAALRIDPNDASTHHRLGVMLHGLDRTDEAMECYLRAVQIKSDFAEAYNNLGMILQQKERRRQAVECYRQALAAKPDYDKARVGKLHQQAHICDWSSRDEDARFVPSLGVTGRVVSTFELLVYDDNPARNRIRAERYAQQTFAPAAPIAAPPPEKPARLRIGYFSSDFHNHATMELMAKLFEVHDRERFVLHAFSYGPPKNDAMQQRVKASFDAFHDVRTLDDRAVADLAHSEALDVAIDLKGYTRHNRTGIFAHRPAPVQISFLGFPGTTGAPFIDYLVADTILIPPEQRAHYSEHILFLPHSYQVNDNTRQIAERVPTRAEVGLPAEGFVFCCFNNPFKITPREFEIWMRLLAQVEGSVLWLLATNRGAEENLRREAQQRGIDPARLVFARLASPTDHLARNHLADLFLDTFDCNAHTTASDALWAGLPVLTKPGQGLVARVAASLLTAIGLPELITADEQAYEALALDLATNPEKLQGIRAKLAANRLSWPLFDTVRFARNIERAYEQAYGRYFAGAQPADMVIEEPPL